MYKKAQLKLQSDFDGFKLQKKLKNLEIFLKAVIFGKRDRIITRNTGKNLIFLDNEFEEISSDGSEYEKDQKSPILDRFKTTIKNMKAKQK